MADNKKFDNKNLKAQQLIKDKIAEQEKTLKPTYKSKMTVTILGNRHNLHVLKEQELVDVYSWLYARQAVATRLHGLLTTPYNYQGSLLGDLLSDIEVRLRVIKKSNSIKLLKKNLDILEDKLSTGKKDEILLSGIFEDLGL